MSINEWVKKITEWGKTKGWNEKLDTHEQIATKLLLVNSEIAEAFEELRCGYDPSTVYLGEGDKPEGFGIEIADALIRLFHLCGLLGLDAEALITQKHAYNLNRPFKHGKVC